MKKVVALCFCLYLFSSCVPNRKLTYLQSKGESAKTLYEVNRTEYLVQPNDIINISIKSYDDEISKKFNNSDLSRANQPGNLIFYINGYTVDNQGFLMMPVLGKLNVRGKSLDQIRELVSDSLNLYFKQKAIFVNVQLSGILFTVIGEVNNPGKFSAFQNRVSIFEAIALAGDITTVGDRMRVQILRQLPSEIQVIELDLTDISVLEAPEFFIKPNDIINVKPLPVKTYGIGTTGFESFASVLSVLASTATLIFTINQLSK